MSSHVLLFKSRPLFVLLDSAPLLKEERDRTPLTKVLDLQTHCSSIGRAPGPDSPPTITHWIPFKDRSDERANQRLTREESDLCRNPTQIINAVDDTGIFDTGTHPQVSGPR